MMYDGGEDALIFKGNDETTRVMAISSDSTGFVDIGPQNTFSYPLHVSQPSTNTIAAFQSDNSNSKEGKKANKSDTKLNENQEEIEENIENKNSSYIINIKV